MDNTELKLDQLVPEYFEDNVENLIRSTEKVAEYMKMLLLHLQEKEPRDDFPITFYGDLTDSLVQVVQEIAKAEIKFAIERRNLRD